MMIIVAEKMFCMLSYPACTLLYLYVNFLACRNRHWRTKLIQRNPPLFVFIPYLYQSPKSFIFNYVLSLYIVAELVIFLTGRPPMQFSSVAQLCQTLCNPMDFSQASLSITNSQSLLKLMSIELVMPSNHLILCRIQVTSIK